MDVFLVSIILIIPIVVILTVKNMFLLFILAFVGYAVVLVAVLQRFRLLPTAPGRGPLHDVLPAQQVGGDARIRRRPIWGKGAWRRARQEPFRKGKSEVGRLERRLPMRHPLPRPVHTRLGPVVHAPKTKPRHDDTRATRSGGCSPDVPTEDQVSRNRG